MIVDLTTSPSPRTHPDTSDAAPPPKERLSLTQVIASTLATVTATAALSLLGVAGTIVGAALASVVTVIGNHLYAASIRRAKEQVAARAAGLHPTLPGFPSAAGVDGGGSAGSAARGAAVQDDSARRGAVLHLGSRKRLLVSMAGLFLAILAVVTALELVAHRPLADVLKGEKASGTSIGGYVETPSPSSSSTTPTTPTTSTSSTSSSTTSSTTSSSAPASTSSSASTSEAPTTSSSSSGSSTSSPGASSTTSDSPTGTAGGGSPTTTEGG